MSKLTSYIQIIRIKTGTNEKKTITKSHDNKTEETKRLMNLIHNNPMQTQWILEQFAPNIFGKTAHDKVGF